MTFSRIDDRDVEILYDYIFNNQPISYLSEKYSLKQPLVVIKRILLRTEILREDEKVNRKTLQNNKLLYTKIKTHLDNKREMDSILDKLTF